jgi:hypothetical protein
MMSPAIRALDFDLREPRCRVVLVRQDMPRWIDFARQLIRQIIAVSEAVGVRPDFLLMRGYTLR